MTDRGLTVGIDLGTTYSAIAYIDPATKAPVPILNAKGQRSTPSVIAFSPDGSVTIGSDAKARAEIGDPDTAAFYKLEMGSRSYKVSFFGKDYNAAELTAIFLRELIAQCEATVGRSITRAVITVPAYFEALERSNTIEAGKNAGLQVLNVINEPTAAAVAYGLRGAPDIRRILIYDLGGGTFDVTAAELDGDMIRVLGSAGNHFLGGKNWDEVICGWLCEQFADEYGIDPSEDREVYNSLMMKAEKAKKLLSFAHYADITVSCEGYSGRYRLTDELFAELSSDLLDITKKTIERLFADIGVSWGEMDGVILVGGSTKMKMVSDFVRKMTGREPLRGADPEEAVAAGAAIQAATEEYCAVKSRTLPSAAGPGYLTKVDHAGYDMKQLPGARFISDVIAHSLGMISVSADGSRFINDIMIKKNTPLSAARTYRRRELTVARREGGSELEIYLLQGESPLPSECTIAKKYVFSGIEYVDGGRTILEIAYSYTVNGTIDIRAVQCETGVELTRQEKPIPDDMSWVSLPPDEYRSGKASPQRGVLYLAIDLSGSMSGEPIALAKEAMKQFAEKFDTSRIKIGIVGFAERAELLLEAESDKRIITAAIDDCDKTDLGCGTSSQPLSLILRSMAGHEEEPFRYAVVLTDGAWFRGSDKQAFEARKEYVASGAEIIALGFGKADEDFLKRLSTRSELSSVDDITLLSKRLLKIAKVIQE